MKSLSHPSINDINLEQILSALSEPTRLAIFKELYSAQDEKNWSSFSSLGQKNNLKYQSFLGDQYFVFQTTSLLRN